MDGEFIRAAVRSEYGSSRVLKVREIGKPEPGPGEILVRVRAAAVSRTDCALLTGEPFVMRLIAGFPKPRARVPGTSFAGTVEAVGPESGSFRKGARVFGFDDHGVGSQAQYAVIPARKPIAEIPKGVTFAQAAASPEGAHYAYNFMNKVDLRAGDRVLVIGAGGAIGSAAVQLLRQAGAKVTAVCGTAQKNEVRALGAEDVIDYQKEDFTRSGRRFSFVFDTVGKSSFARCRRLLEARGTYISSELGKRGVNLLLALVTPVFGGRRVSFPLPLDIGRTLRMLKPLLADGRFRPLIDRAYGLDRIADAYEYVGSGRKFGNVVVRLD